MYQRRSKLLPTLVLLLFVASSVCSQQRTEPLRSPLTSNESGEFQSGYICSRLANSATPREIDKPKKSVLFSTRKDTDSNCSDGGVSDDCLDLMRDDSFYSKSDLVNKLKGASNDFLTNLYNDDPALFSNANIQTVAREMIVVSSSHDGTIASGMLGLVTYLHVAIFREFSEKSIFLDATSKRLYIAAVESFATNPHLWNPDIVGLKILNEYLALCDYKGLRHRDKILSLVKTAMRKLIHEDNWKFGFGIEDTESSAYRSAINTYFSAYNNILFLSFRGINNNDTDYISAVHADTEFIELLFLLSRDTELIANDDLKMLVGNAASELIRMADSDVLYSDVEASIAELASFYPRLTGSWYSATKAINEGGNCQKYNLCEDIGKVLSEVENMLFPNTWIFDDGKLNIRTPLTYEEVQPLYYASKQVQAQFFRLLQVDEPVPNDPSPNLNIVLYGTIKGYIDWQTRLYDLPSDNGGIYIEAGRTFYTFERTAESSIFSLEELFRHEYVHYLQGRYIENGLFGRTDFYEKNRLVWFDEGMAEYLAGSTDDGGVRFRQSQGNSIEKDGELEYLTVSEVLSANYESGFKFYRYGDVLWNYWCTHDITTARQLINFVRADDIQGYDNRINQLKTDDALQASYENYLNDFVINPTNWWNEISTAWIQDELFVIGDIESIKYEFNRITGIDAEVSLASSSSIRRFQATYPITNGNFDTQLDSIIKKLKSNSSVNNFHYITGYYTDVSASSATAVIRGSLSASGVNNNQLYAQLSVDQMHILAGDSIAFTNLSTGYIRFYEWSFAGGTPSTSTERNPVVTYDGAGIYPVMLKVIGKNNLEDTELKSAFITVHEKSTTNYCSATIEEDYGHISNVSFGGLSNASSGFPETGYSDHTNQLVVIAKGVSYPISATTSREYDSRVSVWIDWNQDGDFIDEGENVMSTTEGMIHQRTVAVPTDAVAGVTRMRVRYAYGKEPQTCGLDTYFGEVEDYSVVVIAPSTKTDITTFSFAEQTGAAAIDAVNQTISMEASFGTDLLTLVSTFTASPGATVQVATTDQTSGTTANDFTNPVTYTVTAEDGKTIQDWTVTVTTSQNTEANITAFSFAEQTGAAVMDAESRTISMEVLFETDLSKLVSTLVVSSGATVQIATTDQTSGTTVNDFTSPVTYTVTSEDGRTIQHWMVLVAMAAPPSAKTDIIAFSFAEQAAGTAIDAASRTISMEVPFGTDLSTLVPTFTISSRATVQVGAMDQISGITANDFTNPVTYTVTAEDGRTLQDWAVTVTAPPSAKTNIIAFSFAEQTGGAAINAMSRTISMEVLFGTDLSELVSTFVTAHGATVQVGPTNQVSGITVNDFTNPVTYTVTAEDGQAVQNWTVMVTRAPPSTEVDIASFSFPHRTGAAVIDTESHTISIEVLFGTDLSALVATFVTSQGATVQIGPTKNQVSGITVNDFTNPVTYTVTAEDGQAVQNWTVMVTRIPPSTEVDIASFSFPHRTGAAVIDTESHTISIEVLFGTDLSALVATFVTSQGATVQIGPTDQVSGMTVNDFTNPVTYTVTAENGQAVQGWTVMVTTAAPSTGVDITSFSFPRRIRSLVVDSANHALFLEVVFGSDLSALVSNFTISSRATAQVGTTDQISGTTVNDFTSPVTYTVAAEDGRTVQDWTVAVTRTPPSTETDITTFSFAEQTGTAAIDAASHTISMEVLFGTDLSALVATFVTSQGATVQIGTTDQVSDMMVNDFTNPVIYTVTAEDGQAVQNWTVTVATAPPSTETDITAFSLAEQIGAVAIHAVSHTISMEVLFGTDLSALVATFVISQGATAQIGTADQVSDITANDFTSPVIYTVTAEDGQAVQSWTIMVTTASPSTKTDITTFSFAEQTGAAAIDAVNQTISMEVLFGTDLSELVSNFTLSSRATVQVGTADQVSDITANDFTSPVIYTVTAEDGRTVQDWTVTVTTPLNTKTDITSFSFPRRTRLLVVDSANHALFLEVVFGSDLSTLVSAFTISSGATVRVGTTDQVSGITVNDFTNPVIYAVTAEDGQVVQDWTVRVTTALPSTETDITAFSLAEQKGAAAIDTVSHTLTLDVVFGTNPIALISTFTISSGATAQVGTTGQTSGITINDFTNPVTYTVTAEDGRTLQDWTITVMAQPLGLADFEHLQIYPNPSSDRVMIAGLREPYSLNLMDILGKTVLVGTNNRALDLSELKAGLYLLEITTNSKAKRVIKLFKLD